MIIRILERALRLAGRFAVWRFKPSIIGITGSAGKSMAKEAITFLFSHPSRRFSFRTSPEGLFGQRKDSYIPLTLIRGWTEDEMDIIDSSGGNALKRWTRALIWLKAVFGCFRNFFPIPLSYPEVLILEYKIDRQKTFRDDVLTAKPKIVIVTSVSNPPPHSEQFNSPEGVIREKSRLIEALSSQGVAILNYDDKKVLSMKEKTRAAVMTFGFEEGSDLRIVEFQNHFEKNRFGISFKIEYGGSVVPVAINNVFGKSPAYAAAASACVGLIFNLNLVEISEALGELRHSKKVGMHLIFGIKSTSILDCSCHATPASISESLDILSEFPGARRIAVMGDMLGLGKYAIEAHENAGKKAKEICDLLVTVGPRGKFIAEGAKYAGMPDHLIYSCDISFEAGKLLQEIMKKGDVILITGSKEMGLRNVVCEVEMPNS